MVDSLPVPSVDDEVALAAFPDAIEIEMSDLPVVAANAPVRELQAVREAEDVGSDGRLFVTRR